MVNQDVQVTYYAILDEDDPEGEPAGIVRRAHTEPLPRDEAYGRDGWHPTDYLDRYYLWGTNESDHVEITPGRAMEIIEQWNARWGTGS